MWYFSLKFFISNLFLFKNLINNNFHLIILEVLSVCDVNKLINSQNKNDDYSSSLQKVFIIVAKSNQIVRIF